MKKALVIGMQEVVYIKFSCPHCGEEFEQPFEDFSETIGDPYMNEQQGEVLGCVKCGKSFELGIFAVV